MGNFVSATTTTNNKTAQENRKQVHKEDFFTLPTAFAKWRGRGVGGGGGKRTEDSRNSLVCVFLLLFAW